MSRMGAMILAAGMSSRMGSFKILLPWVDRRPILLHVIDLYITLNIDPIFVITGRDSERVQATVDDLPVTCVHNADYAHGEILSSVKTGLRAMPTDVAATFIHPADMPLVPQTIIQQLHDAYQPHTILAPRYGDQRGHPILLDRVFWSQMLQLPADAAPRDAIKANKQHLHFLDTDDDGVIVDIDTPERYQYELQRAQR
jgi:molybdenum cofactor cytidylyltransferase